MSAVKDGSGAFLFLVFLIWLFSRRRHAVGPVWETTVKRGDFVWIEREGQRVQAMVVLASENQDSLMLMFDAMFQGYAGMMPLLREDGVYRDLINGWEIAVSAANAAN